MHLFAGRVAQPNPTKTGPPALGILLDLALCTSSLGASLVYFTTYFIINQSSVSLGSVSYYENIIEHEERLWKPQIYIASWPEV